VDRRFSLICFAHAGAGATEFALWPQFLPDWLDLHAHVAPGREERAKESSLGSVEELVVDASPEIDNLPEQLVLVGHSFGAMVAYEMAHLLVSSDRPPAHLIVLAASPPSRTPAPPRDDNELTSLWIRLGADPAPLARPQFRRMVFPILRADMAAHAAYQPPRRDPLPVPVTVMYGDTDPSVAAEDVAAWRPLCAETFDLVAMPGGHFFPRESVAATVHAIIRTLLR